jgi:predicted ATPase with chaperone activity
MYLLCTNGTTYLNKISGPLLDRIDLRVEVTPVAFSELSSPQLSEPSSVIRERVIAARNIQAERFKDHPGIYCNAIMGSKLLKEICVLDNASTALLKTAMERLNLSARAYDRILKVSRTMEAKLSASNNDELNIKDLLGAGISSLLKLDHSNKGDDIEQRRDMISSMYPENLTFGGIAFRTSRINESRKNYLSDE